MPLDEDNITSEDDEVQKHLESLWPHPDLKPHRDAYRWLGGMHLSQRADDAGKQLLWGLLGATTTELLREHLSGFAFADHGSLVLAPDLPRVLGGFAIEPADDGASPSADEVFTTLHDQLLRKFEGEHGTHYRSLAERLEDLRNLILADARGQIDMLRQALDLAREFVELDRAAQDAGEEGVVDVRRGALTQVLAEAAPQGKRAMLDAVAAEIDKIVSEIVKDRSFWQTSTKAQRMVRTAVLKVLKRHHLHQVEGLFDRAYAYLEAQYCR